jgi:hypothetical protein
MDVKIAVTIPMRPAVDMYNATWKAPARNFHLDSSIDLSFRSCDFSAYLIGIPNVNQEIPLCTGCDEDTGYGEDCYNSPPRIWANTLTFKFVRRKEAEAQQRQNAEVLTLSGFMDWTIVDQSSCAAASVDKATFACTSNHSSCVDTSMGFGYTCKCDDGYGSNPFVLNGCSRDYGNN